MLWAQIQYLQRAIADRTDQIVMCNIDSIKARATKGRPYSTLSLFQHSKVQEWSDYWPQHHPDSDSVSTAFWSGEIAFTTCRIPNFSYKCVSLCPEAWTQFVIHTTHSLSIYPQDLIWNNGRSMKTPKSSWQTACFTGLTFFHSIQLQPKPVHYLLIGRVRGVETNSENIF